MNRYLILFLSLSFLYFVTSCDNAITDIKEHDSNGSSANKKEVVHLLADHSPLHEDEDGDINAIIEIPSGTLEKWELNKSSGKIEWQMVNNTPRIIDYLGYPGNYGMIPRTLLSKEKGGDGDPLDIIVLGPPEARGSVIKCKVVGVLYLIDRGEQDDKLIAVSTNSPLYEVNSLSELEENYIGVSEILKLWFTNYKGPGKIVSKGFGNKNDATDILESAISEYKLMDNHHN